MAFDIGPGTIAGVFSKRNENQVKEYIGANVMELMRRKRPVFEDLILSEAQEYISAQDTGYGRNYIRVKQFKGAAAGTVSSAGVKDYFTIAGDAATNLGNRLFKQSLTQTFPDATQSATGRAVEMATTIHGHLFNLLFTLDELREEANPANMDRYVLPKLNGMSEQINGRVANEWFADSDNRICTILDSTEDNINHTIEFKIGGGVTSRLFPGQEIDIYDEVDTTSQVAKYDRLNKDGSGNRLPAWVVAVDPYKERATIYVDSGVTLGSLVTDGTSYLAIASSEDDGGYLHKIYGWRDWAVPTGATDAEDRKILGARADSARFIDVDQWPEFASPYFNVNGPLTPTKLMNYLATIGRGARLFGHEYDTLLMSWGIMQNMIEQRVGSLRRDDSRPLGVDSYQPDDRPDSLVITGPNGNRMDIRVDDCLESGTVLGLRRRGNWEICTINEGAAGKRVTSIPGVSPKLPLYSPLIEAGGDSFLHPITKTSSGDAGATNLVTQGFEMPMYSTFQIEPKEQIPMFVLKNVTDTRVYTDDGPVDLTT